MPADTITVPEGHRIVVVHPVDRPRLGQLECGLIVVDYGNGDDWQATHMGLDALWAKRTTSVLVILQSAMIERLRESGRFTSFFDDWQRRNDGGTSTLWVLPSAASSDIEAIAKIRAIGHAVYASAADGACFVEVHKPDGTITIGMTGPAL